MKKLLSCLVSFLFLAFPLPSFGRSTVVPPGEYIAEGGWGNLRVTRNGQGGLSFEILTIGANAHTCSLSGEIRGGRAVLEEDGDHRQCVVTFEPTGKGIRVTDDGDACRAYCGMRAAFTYQYLKPQPECAPAAMQKTRAEFKRLYDRKSYALARARLEPVLKKCSALIHWSDMGWILNDLAITQYRLGDYAGCRNTLQPLTGDAGKTDEELREEYPPSDADIALPIAGATRTNLRLCTSGKKKQ